MKKKLKYVLLILFFSLSVFVMTGCWDKRDVTHLGVVSGVAIDKEENGQIRLTVDLLNGSPGNAGNVRASGDFHLTAYGDTVYQAVSNLESINNRSLSWQHNSIIMISENALDEDIFNYIDMFIRKDLSPKTYIVVTPDRAFDLINTPIGDDWINSLGIARLLYVQAKQHQGKGHGVSINDFITASATPEAAPYLPILVLQEKEPDKEESVTSESATSQGQLTEQVVLDGFLVFKDGLQVGELGEAATKGLILYTGREKTSSISVPGIDGGMVNLEIVQIKVKPKFKVEDGVPKVKAEVEIYSTILELVDEDMPQNQEEFRQLEKQQRHVIEQLFTQTLRESQALRADVLQIGQLARTTNYKWWKENKNQWMEIFPQVQMELDIKSNIYYTGNIRSEVKPK